MALTLTDDDIAKINALIDGKLNALKNEATDVTGLSENTDSTGSLMDVSSNTPKKYTVKKSSITLNLDDATAVQLDILQKGQ